MPTQAYALNLPLELKPDGSVTFGTTHEPETDVTEFCCGLVKLVWAT